MKFLKNILIGLVCLPASLSAGNPDSALIAGSNKFAFMLLSRLELDKNVFFSPYSISAALAITYAGADGNTARQMAGVLNFPVAGNGFYSAWKSRIDGLNLLNVADTALLRSNNALFMQKDYVFLETFRSIAVGYFGAGIHLLDFMRDTEGSRKQINAWVAGQTDGKIKNLISPGLLDELTRLVLVNTILFKARWDIRFDPARTTKGLFYSSPSDTLQADFMSTDANLLFQQSDEFSSVYLTYAGKRFAMIILMPEGNGNLQALRKELNNGLLAKLMQGYEEQKIRLFLPRFSMKYEVELSAILSAMGMPEAFTDQADFSGMTGKKDLKISKVIHQAVVDVNEEGTEAAAATAVVMRVKSMPAKPKEYRVDRPFLFMICDTRSGGVLFAGSCVYPTKK